MKNLLTILAILTALSGCRAPATLNYFYTFPNNDSSHMYVHESFEVPIAVGDQLNISVSAANQESIRPYIVPDGKLLTVEQDGKIIYPQFGKIVTAGLTKSQLRDVLVGRLKEFVNDPLVIVDYSNFKVTVLGEVSKQGSINVPDGKINILEALAQSGDITVYGKKHQVLVIREKNGNREFGWVNLLSHDVFTTPYYRLQQNDIVYVPSVENKPTADAQVQTRNISLVASFVAIISAIGFLILNLIQ